MIYKAVYPLMVGFNSIPKVAFVPVLVVWFGIGTVPAILTAFLISFFPVVVNMATAWRRWSQSCRTLCVRSAPVASTF